MAAAATRGSVTVAPHFGASRKVPIRWGAIHHGASVDGNDHIHVAATMVREDGTRWDGRFNEYKTAQAAARAIEVKFGLATVSGREFGTAVPGGEASRTG